jgi:hypothetical protein
MAGGDLFPIADLIDQFRQWCQYTHDGNSEQVANGRIWLHEANMHC